MFLIGEDMEETVISLMNNYGYLGILLLIMLENIFPPIPSEIILGFGGFMTKTTNLTMFGVIFIATIGSCLGAMVLYYLGRFLNKERLISCATSKIGKILRITPNDIERTNEWFIKRGAKAILFGRFVPIIRSLISIPAGMSAMNFQKFLFFTFIGTFIWNGILTIVGSVLGNNWYKIVIFIGNYSLIVIVILFIIFLLLLYLFLFKRKINP